MKKMSSSLRLLKTVTPSSSSSVPALVDQTLQKPVSVTPSPIATNGISKSFSTLRSRLYQ